MTKDELTSHLKEIITPLFPQNVKIDAKPNYSEILFNIRWKLDEPQGYSKTIELSMSGSAIDDYIANLNDQQVFDDRITKFLHKKLQQFDPYHNHSRYDHPPKEEWIIPNYS